jgi:hypothetical protein
LGFLVFWLLKQSSEQLAVHFGSLFIKALFDSCAAAPPSSKVLRHPFRKKREKRGKGKKGNPPKAENGKRVKEKEEEVKAGCYTLASLSCM